MNQKQRISLRRMVTILMLVATAMIGPLAMVGATASPAAAATSDLSVDLTGNWTDYGPARPWISLDENGYYEIDMSYAGRPTATILVTGPTTFYADFPDAGWFLGTVVSNTQIYWSNGSTWTEVYSGPTRFDLNGDGYWSDGSSVQYISNQNGYLTVAFTNGRPNALGYVVDDGNIQVTFFDDATYTAYISTLGALGWSNGSAWFYYPYYSPCYYC